MSLFIFILFILLVLFWKQGPTLYQVSLKLKESSCLSLPSAMIKDMYHVPSYALLFLVVVVAVG